MGVYFTQNALDAVILRSYAENFFVVLSFLRMVYLVFNTFFRMSVIAHKNG